MAFIRNGTKLVYCAPDSGLRIWDISGLMDEHRHMSLYCQPWVIGYFFESHWSTGQSMRATIAWSGNRGTLREGNERGLI